MESFVFHNPTRIHFGIGKTAMLGREMRKAGVKQALLIAGGGSIRQNNVYNQVCASLKDSGINWTEAWGVQANPTLEKARDIIRSAQNERPDAILAVGGGSVIDTAKSVAAGFFLPDIWDAFTGQARITRALPIYTVLTISAAGSEMNGNAVITNMAGKQKWSFSSELVYPQVTIIDPAAQCSLPFRQTVNGALDAMAHILEFFFVNNRAVATLALDAALLRTIGEMTDRLQADANDIIARANLAWSATLALNGISGAGLQNGDWACHAIEHSLSALYPKIAHGEGLGVIFPAWIEYMGKKDPTRFAGWAQDVWAADCVLSALLKFRDKIRSWGAPNSLRELGIREDELPVLLQNITDQDRIIGAVSKLRPKELEALLQMAF